MAYLAAVLSVLLLNASAQRAVDTDEVAALQVKAETGSSRHQRQELQLSSGWVPAGKILSADAVARAKKWHGVNYGNRFVPEEWIKVPYYFFDGVEPYSASSRVALWDVYGAGAKHRMLKWLDETIWEEDFAEMARYGVEVLRLPVGYWNFVSYEGEDGPAVPPGYEEIGERMKNLHRIASPEEYRPYLDRCFDFAKKYGLKILLDLHGLPGSQNGEIHSGACIEETKGGKNKALFKDEANKQMAVRAIEAMAKYASAPDRLDTLWGLQVINEPHLDDGHEFLKSFYEQAIQAARKHLDASKRVVLFVWTFDMHLWPDSAFPADKWGQIIWDTHLYHFPDGGKGETWSGEDGLEKAKMAYSEDLAQLRSFTRSKGNPVIVGEYSMAGPTFDAKTANTWIRWLVDEFDFAAIGSLLWTFDCQWSEWSMQKLVKEDGFDWPAIWKADRDICIEGPRVTLKSRDGNTYLSARENGEVWLGVGQAQFWESWSPCYYKVNGNDKVAFRSEAHGGWLSVTDTGQVRQAWTRSAWEEFEVPVLKESGSEQQIEVISGVQGSAMAERNGQAAAERAPAWSVSW